MNVYGSLCLALRSGGKETFKLTSREIFGAILLFSYYIQYIILTEHIVKVNSYTVSQTLVEPPDNVNNEKLPHKEAVRK